MSRDFHEACNTTLRTAAADLLATGRGGFAFLGCFMNEDGLGWATLPGLTWSLAEAADRHRSGSIELATVYDAIAAVTDGLSVTDCPEEVEHLRGIALACNVDDGDRGRVCLADAAFADAWRHTVTWYAADAAPSFTVTSPPEQTDAGLVQQQAVPDLLEAVLRLAGQQARFVGAEQRRLSVCLRDLVAEMTAQGCHAVFVIARTGNGWEALPANDLSAYVGAALAGGANLVEAVGQLAAELAADPPAIIPTLQGVGTLVHYDHDDGSTEAQLIAVTDQFMHAASWVHGHSRPDWEIRPATTSDAAYAPMVTAYTRVLEAFRGRTR